MRETYLTDRPADAASPSPSFRPERAGRDLLSRALGRARWSIFWERLWPALASVATVIGLFLALSWLGLWLWLPPIGRAIGFGFFFLLTAAALAPFLIAAGAEQNGGSAATRPQFRPAASAGHRDRRRDRFPEPRCFVIALWRAHVERALRSAKTLRAGVPAPRLALWDPFALRAWWRYWQWQPSSLPAMTAPGASPPRSIGRA